MEWRRHIYKAWKTEDGWFYTLYIDGIGHTEGAFKTERKAMKHLDDAIDERRQG